MHHAVDDLLGTLRGLATQNSIMSRSTSDRLYAAKAEADFALQETLSPAAVLDEWASFVTACEHDNSMNGATGQITDFVGMLHQHDLSADLHQGDSEGSSQDGSVLAPQPAAAGLLAAGTVSPDAQDTHALMTQHASDGSDDDENSHMSQDPLRDHMMRSICELVGNDSAAVSSIDIDELASLSTPRLATYMVQLQKAAELSLSQAGNTSLNLTARTPPRAPRTPQHHQAARTPTPRGAAGCTPIPVQVAALKQRLAAALKDNADLRKVAAAASTSQSASSVAARGAARDAASKAELLRARLDQVVAQNEALDAQHQQLVVGLHSMRWALLDAIPADQRGSSSSLNISAISAASDASVPSSHKSETTLLHSVQSLLGKALAGYREHVAAARDLGQARDAAAGAQANAARATQELASAQEAHARAVRELKAQLQAATRDAQAARDKAASDTQAALRTRNAQVASAAADAQRALADLRHELAGTTARADQAEAELSRAQVSARQARTDAVAAQDAARIAQNQVLSLQERLALALKSRPAGSPRDAALLGGDTLFSLSSGSDDEDDQVHMEGKRVELGAVSVTSAGSHEPVQAAESMLPRARAGSPTMQALHMQAAGQRRDATDLALAKSQVSRLQRQLHVAGVDTARAKELWRSAAEINFAAVTRVLKAADAVLSQLPAQEEGAITAADWLPKLSADVPEHLKAALRESALSPTGGADQHVPAAVHIGLMGVTKRLGAQMAAAMKSAASSAAQLHEMRQVLDARDDSIAALGTLAQDLQDQLDNARDEIQQLEHAQPSEAAAVRAARAEVATAWRAAEAAQREADVAKLALAKAETRASSIRAETARAAAEDELARARAAIGPVDMGTSVEASQSDSTQEISSSAGLHAALRTERDRLAATEQDLTRATQALQMTQLQYAGRVELLRSQLGDAQAECVRLSQDLDIARTDAASRPSAAAWADAQSQVRALELELEAAEEAGLHRADLQARAHALRKERADAARLRRPGAGPPARQPASYGSTRPGAVLQAACAELGLSDVTALPGAVRVLHKTVRAVQGLEVFVRACQEASVALQDAVHSSQQSLRQTAMRASQAAENMQLAQHSGHMSAGAGEAAGTTAASSALWSSMSEMCAALATVSGHIPECISPELQAPARALPAPLQVILQVLATTISQLRTLPGLLVVLHRLAGQACGTE